MAGLDTIWLILIVAFCLGVILTKLLSEVALRALGDKP